MAIDSFEIAINAYFNKGVSLHDQYPFHIYRDFQVHFLYKNRQQHSLDQVLQLFLMSRRLIDQWKGEDLSKDNITYIEYQTKDWVDEKFLGKIKDVPSHLKPVIALAAKDATMLVAACLLGKITLDSDDANYTAMKQKFIDLVVLNKKFRNEFDGALISKQSNYNDVCTICQVF